MSRKLEKQIKEFASKYNPDEFGKEMKKLGIPDQLVDEVYQIQFKKLYDAIIRLSKIKTYIK